MIEVHIFSLCFPINTLTASSSSHLSFFSDIWIVFVGIFQALSSHPASLLTPFLRSPSGWATSTAASTPSSTLVSAGSSRKPSPAFSAPSAGEPLHRLSNPKDSPILPTQMSNQTPLISQPMRLVLVGVVAAPFPVGPTAVWVRLRFPAGVC